MRTQDFIKEVATGQRTKAGKCASVFFESGALYSYGYHYPLLVKIGGAWIVNDRGYSSTTGRHISYARQYATYRAEFNRNLGTANKENILTAVKDSIKNLQDHLKELSPRAFRQKETTENRLKELNATREYLESVKE